MQYTSPYLNFPGNAEEAFEFYRSVFGGEFSGIVRYRDLGDNTMEVPEAEMDKVAHISLPFIGDISLMGSDIVGPMGESFTAGTNVYVYLEAESAEEAERVFSALADGGTVEMPLQPVDWAEKYGSCIDKYDIPWMISYTGDVEYSI